MRLKWYIICATLGIALLIVMNINAFFPLKVRNRQTKNLNDFRLEISDPIVVAQAGINDEQSWGFFQFPRMCYTENGNILMKVAYKPDTNETLSGKYLYYISEDEGKTWRECNEQDSLADYTLLMENGLYYQGPQLNDTFETDEFDGVVPYYSSGDESFKLFNIEDSTLSKTFTSSEYDPNSKKEIVFESQYSWEKRQYAVRNGLVYPNGWCLYHFKMHAPDSIAKENDGSLFAATYWYGGIDTGNFEKYNVHFLRSDDYGRKWNYVSSILSEGICDENSEGLCEPVIKIIKNGTYVVLMRSGSGLPSYISYSSDKGETWSKPYKFSDIGVDPQLLTLDCGVTLASFGRPAYM